MYVCYTYVICIHSIHTSQTPRFFLLGLPAACLVFFFFFFVVCACIQDIKPCAFVCPEGATGSPPPLRGRQSWLLLALVSLRDRVSGLLVKQGPEDRASSHLWFSVTSLVPSAALQLEGRHPALWGTGLVSGAGPGWRKQVWSLVI